MHSYIPPGHGEVERSPFHSREAAQRAKGGGVRSQEAQDVSHLARKVIPVSPTDRNAAA